MLFFLPEKSERLSLENSLSEIKEAPASDGCSSWITASDLGRREIIGFIKHKNTGEALIKTKLA